jgi:hypothetical protein
MIRVDQQRVSRAVYDTLTPYEQGYTSYFQSYWPKSEIPKMCHHPQDSEAAVQWRAGSKAAMIAVLDVEE